MQSNQTKFIAKLYGDRRHTTVDKTGIWYVVTSITRTTFEQAVFDNASDAIGECQKYHSLYERVPNL